MGEWKEYKFSDLLVDESISYGIVQPGFHTADGIPIIRVNNIRNGKINIDDVLKVSQEVESKYNRTRLEGGELLITVVGTVGECAMVPNELKGWNVARAVSVAKIKNSFNKQFIRYCFKTDDLIHQMYGNTNDTVQPTLNLSSLKELKFNLPPIPEQTAIAEVLSSLDDKIDLLHRQNKTLEQLAETLFRQWFVEEAEESWVEKRLKEIVSLVIDNRGKTPPTVECTTDYPLIEVNALNSGTCLINYDVIRKYVLKETYENWFRKHLKENDIIFSTVGTIGVFSIFLENIGAIAQNLIGLRFEKFSPYFIYCFFKLNVENIINLDIGGVQPSIKVPHLLEMTLKCPPQTLLDEFHKSVDANFQKIKSNTQQIRTLTQLRDTLLPKLMSGEVRVDVKSYAT